MANDYFILMLQQELKPQEATCYSLDTLHAHPLALLYTRSLPLIRMLPFSRWYLLISQESAQLWISLCWTLPYQQPLSLPDPKHTHAGILVLRSALCS